MRSMSMNLPRFALLLLLVLSGCSEPRREYVVYRDIPADPSITVLPSRTYNIEDQRATAIVEERMVEHGIHVINRPPAHDLVVTKGAGDASAEVQDKKSAAKAKGEAIEQHFDGVLDLKSTFAFLVNAGTEKIRVVRVDSQQVVGIIDYNSVKGNAWVRATSNREEVNSNSLIDLLTSLGFKVKL